MIFLKKYLNLLERCWVRLSSPEAIVFFGGLTKAGDLLMKPIEKSYNEHVMPIFKGHAKLLVSTLDGAGAAVLGASALGWEIK